MPRLAHFGSQVACGAAGYKLPSSPLYRVYAVARSERAAVVLTFAVVQGADGRGSSTGSP